MMREPFFLVTSQQKSLKFNFVLDGSSARIGKFEKQQQTVVGVDWQAGVLDLARQQKCKINDIKWRTTNKLYGALKYWNRV